MNEGTVTKYHDGRAVQVPVSRLHPRELDVLRRGIAARKAHCLALLGRQRGGLAAFALVVKVVPMGAQP